MATYAQAHYAVSAGRRLPAAKPSRAASRRCRPLSTGSCRWWHRRLVSSTGAAFLSAGPSLTRASFAPWAEHGTARSACWASCRTPALTPMPPGPRVLTMAGAMAMGCTWSATPTAFPWPAPSPRLPPIMFLLKDYGRMLNRRTYIYMLPVVEKNSNKALSIFYPL